MRERLSKTDIVIDLTSLLDVIFIVLLIVMCSEQHGTMDAKSEAAAAQESVSTTLTAAQETLDTAEDMLKAAEETKELYDRHTEEYENVDTYVRFIDITSSYDSAGDLSIRSIRVISGLNASNEEKVISVTAATEQSAYDTLYKYLESEIAAAVNEEGQTTPVILTVNKNDENILYRDEVAIENIFRKLSEEYDSVFLR